MVPVQYTQREVKILMFVLLQMLMLATAKKIKIKSHKHLFNAACTYRVFKLFAAVIAACEMHQITHIYFPPGFYFFPCSPPLPPSSGYDLMCQFKTDCLYGSDGERGYGVEIWPP